VATVAAIALVLGPAAAWADVVLTDGDGAVPFAGNDLSFGTNLCPGTTLTKSVLIGIRRDGGSNSQQVFANGATVAVSVTSVSGVGISTTPDSGSVGTITLPGNWKTELPTAPSAVAQSACPSTSTPHQRVWFPER